MPCLCVLLRRKGKFTEYRNLDVIWKHPESGGKVFCGNLTAAQTKGILEEHGITHILNCQELKSRNYFEEDPNFTYGRMPVATWGGYSLQRKTDTIGNLLLQHLAFVQNAVAEGHNVLIHCLAGAHRAGTASVAFIMLSSRSLPNEKTKGVRKPKKKEVRQQQQQKKRQANLEPVSFNFHRKRADFVLLDQNSNSSIASCPLLQGHVCRCLARCSAVSPNHQPLWTPCHHAGTIPTTLDFSRNRTEQ
eukprot:c18538_g1_i6.p1 GENE.c18538_g1_i6~~c18538_g1_i6.p1  ORF type:complete len:247 (+),score=28.16 c18538_g1_i6:173-913(+)